MDSQPQYSRQVAVVALFFALALGGCANRGARDIQPDTRVEDLKTELGVQGQKLARAEDRITRLEEQVAVHEARLTELEAWKTSQESPTAAVAPEPEETPVDNEEPDPVIPSPDPEPDAAETPQEILEEPEEDRELRFAAHLASYRTERAAREGWEVLRERFETLFDTLEPRLQRVTLGNEGERFYRLKIGPLTGDDAEMLCRELANRSSYCSVSDLEGDPF